MGVAMSGKRILEGIIVSALVAVFTAYVARPVARAIVSRG
jgi:hypothetical protein